MSIIRMRPGEKRAEEAPVEMVRTNTSEADVKDLTIGALQTHFNRKIHHYMSERTMYANNGDDIKFVMCRPDLALVNGIDIHIIEVKTFTDMMKDEQFSNYRTLGNYLWFSYCEGSFVERHIDFVPDDVGLIEIDLHRNVANIVRLPQRHELGIGVVMYNIYAFQKARLKDISDNYLLQRIYAKHLWWYSKIINKDSRSRITIHEHKEKIKIFTKQFKLFMKRLDKFIKLR